MNNIKNILLMVVVTSLLVIGTRTIPMQSFADQHKKECIEYRQATYFFLIFPSKSKWDILFSD
jgi:hypothetical protein